MTQPDTNYPAAYQAPPPPPYIPGGQYAVQQGQAAPDGGAPAPAPAPAPAAQPPRGQQGQPYNVAKHGPIRIDRDRAAKPVEWESFLYVGDTEYKIMKTDSISPATSLQFISVAQQRGEMVAVAEMIDIVIAPKGMIRDLSSVEGIEIHEVNVIMTVIADKLMAAGQMLAGK